MTLKITLTADPTTGAGVDFNAGLESYFDGFTPFEMPWFLEPTGSTETTQILHLDTPTAGTEAETRVVMLEGQDFLYTFSNHSVSGTIQTIRLATLGAGWDAAAEDLALDGGVLTAQQDWITIEGLNIVNPAGEKGAVHDIVSGLMGGGLNGTAADPDPILSHLFAEGHDVTGSSGNDRYSGTGFADTVQGGTGRDTLAGGAGADRLMGGSGADVLTGGGGKDHLSGDVGADRLTGGLGADVLTGGGGADRFIFTSAKAAAGDRITDFTSAQGDRIVLTQIDADSSLRGNQAFTFVGDAAFSGDAGELRAVAFAGGLRVLGDLDGDGQADFRFTVSGATTLGAEDFLL